MKNLLQKKSPLKQRKNPQRQKKSLQKLRKYVCISKFDAFQNTMLLNLQIIVHLQVILVYLASIFILRFSLNILCTHSLINNLATLLSDLWDCLQPKYLHVLIFCILGSPSWRRWRRIWRRYIAMILVNYVKVLKIIMK